ncbi:hypothetical protein [Caulobacter sp.]|uniref:hypothetical protein n=1 Tax=Caulobacter sp. TaxID=78 RepID=UPI003BAE7DE7
MTDASMTMDIEEYQDIANSAASAVFGLISSMHAITYGPSGGNGGPLISGTGGGLLQYMTDSDITDDQIKSVLGTVIEQALPQIRMAQASRGIVEGHA